MITKQKKVATRLGTFGEVLYALAPKSVDVILNTGLQAVPRELGGQGREEEEGRARLERGRRVRVPDARRALVAAVAVSQTPRSSHVAATSGAGATRTSSPRRSELRTALPTASARTSASSRPSVELPGRARATSSCRRRGSSRPASLGGDLLHRPARSRLARLRQGLPRRRARLPRPLRPPARRRRAPARRGRRRRAARLVRRAPAWRRSPTAAAPASSAASRRRSATATRARCRSTSAGSTACSRSTERLARRTDPGRRDRPAHLEEQLRDARPRRCATSRSRSSSRRSAAGSRHARAATSRPLYTHIDDLVESIARRDAGGRDRDAPPARLGRRARARTGC